MHENAISILLEPSCPLTCIAHHQLQTADYLFCFLLFSSFFSILMSLSLLLFSAGRSFPKLDVRKFKCLATTLYTSACLSRSFSTSQESPLSLSVETKWTGFCWYARTVSSNKALLLNLLLTLSGSKARSQNSCFACLCNSLFGHRRVHRLAFWTACRISSGVSALLNITDHIPAMPLQQSSCAMTVAVPAICL